MDKITTATGQSLKLTPSDYPVNWSVRIGDSEKNYVVPKLPSGIRMELPKVDVKC